jgi:hypothetical protein
MVYHGPKAMEELVRYDPHLVVGILGGSAGTTYDAFKLLGEAMKYGARVALFGRKINNAENQLAFIHFLRLIADGEVSPEEAVRAYHAVLQQLGVKPRRALEEDMRLQTNVMSYSGSGVTVSAPTASNGQPQHAACACRCACRDEATVRPDAAPPNTGPQSEGDGQPDFQRMTPAQKVAYHKARWDRILG